MARIVVVHPGDLNFVGGAEAVCAYTVEALSRDHEVTVVTWAEPDRRHLDACFGTSLSSASFEVVTTSQRVRAPAVVADRLLFRCVVSARLVASEFAECDLVVSTYGEIATRVPTIQYVHHPVYSSRVPHRVLAGTEVGLGEWAVKNGARVVARLLTGGSRDAYARNITLTNSAYMAKWIRHAWGLSARVLWPPVPLAIQSHIPWESREAGLVCVGRLHPGKRILELIRAVERARALGADLHLHVVGDGGGAYADAVRDACRKSPCPTYEGLLSLADLSTLLASHRFGVHGFPYEHFGIALAQMVRAGCICFAPSGGAPADLLAATPFLLFDDFQELASHLVTVAGDVKLQAQLRIDLQPLREAFDRHRFGGSITDIVSTYLDGHGRTALSIPA